METSPNTPPSPVPPAPVPSTLPSTAHSHRTLYALFFGAIAVIAIIVILWKFGSFNHHNDSSAHLILTASALTPPAPVQIVDLDTGKTRPYTVAGQGTAVVADIALGKDRSYYLISNPQGTQSNLYYADMHHPDAGLSQATMSTGLKSGLTYDEQSGLVAFTIPDTQDVSSGTIMLARTGTTTLQELAKGTAPIFLKGGFFLVYENNGKILSLNIATGMSHELLDIPAGGAYAIDGNALQAVIYQPGTNTFEYYTLAGLTAASYERSEKATQTQAPRLLALSRKTLVEGIVGSDRLVFRVGSVAPKGVSDTLRYQTGRILYLP